MSYALYQLSRGYLKREKLRNCSLALPPLPIALHIVCNGGPGADLLL